MSQVSSIRIHPGIGIARVGNSPEHFIGPEAPGFIPDPGGTGGPGPDGGTYKDAQQQIKAQAQRFRIYGYDADGNVVGEINGSDAEVESVEWRVHVRNMKAANYAFQGPYLFDPKALRNGSIQPGLAPIDRDQLIVDPGPRTISSADGGEIELTGTIFDGVDSGTLPGYLRFNPPQNTPPESDVPVKYSSADVTLGKLALDEAQRLIFVAGPGESKSVTTPAVDISNPSEHYDPPNGPPDLVDPNSKQYDPSTAAMVNQFAYFNVPGWYDDTCGGSVDVTVKLKNGQVLSTLVDGQRDPARGAWVVTAPPKYSPWMYHVVSILDRVYDAYPEADPANGKPTEFYRDIYPILEMATNYAWVSAEAFGPQGTAHGPGQPGDLLSDANLKAFMDPGPGGQAARQQIYNIMRHPEPYPTDPPPSPVKLPPGEPSTNAAAMPKLWGSGGKPLQNQQLGNDFPNQYLALTDSQLRRMKDWADGKFTVGEKVAPRPLDQWPLAEQPAAMDAAALQPTIGGGFHPGIEFPYLILYQQFFAGPFRVAAGVEPGSVAAYMSCPWQGDFWSCNTAWWPVQRPEIVVDPNDHSKTLDWFRGYDPDTGEPLSQDDGYNQMVAVWWQLGMVYPTGAVDQGEPVFAEAERDPALDKKPGNAP